MSPEARIDAFKKTWDGVWHGSGDEAVATIAASYADDIKIHIAPIPEPLTKPAWGPFVQGWHAAFPDGRMEIEDIIVDPSGDKLWCYWISTGTHSAPYLNVPATGKKVAYRGVDICRFEGDKLAENWQVPDVLSLLQQLGAIPTGG